MLKTVERSSNSKTGPIAVTYRAGKTSPYSSCPATCSLMPADQCGAVQLDEEYMQALLDAVPRRGLAWTYSPIFRPKLCLFPSRQDRSLMPVATLWPLRCTLLSWGALLFTLRP